MAFERPRVRKFPQLVTYHILRNIDRYVLLAVMDSDGQPNKIGQNRRAARPGFDWTFVIRCTGRFHLGYKVQVNKWALLYGTCHIALPFG